MLLRCAARTVMGPMAIAGGLVLAAGAAATLALGATALGGAMLVKRMREERSGWRDADAAGPAPADHVTPDAPAS